MATHTRFYEDETGNEIKITTRTVPRFSIARNTHVDDMLHVCIEKDDLIYMNRFLDKMETRAIALTLVREFNHNFK